MTGKSSAGPISEGAEADRSEAIAQGHGTLCENLGVGSMHQLSELKLHPAALRIETAFVPAGPSQGLHRKETFIHMHSEMARRLRRQCYSNRGSAKEGWDRLWFLPEVQPL